MGPFPDQHIRWPIKFDPVEKRHAFRLAMEASSDAGIPKTLGKVWNPAKSGRINKRKPVPMVNSGRRKVPSGNRLQLYQGTISLSNISAIFFSARTWNS